MVDVQQIDLTVAGEEENEIQHGQVTALTAVTVITATEAIIVIAATKMVDTATMVVIVTMEARVTVVVVYHRSLGCVETSIISGGRAVYQMCDKIDCVVLHQGQYQH